MILASSNMQVSDYGSKGEHAAQEALANAWKSKYKQASQKAKLSFGDTYEYKQLEELSKQKSAKKGFSSWSFPGKVAWIILNIYTLGIPAIIYSLSRK